MAPRTNTFDRMVAFFAPRSGVRRERARIALEMLRALQPYEAAGYGRRQRGWYSGGITDANVGGLGIGRLRELARDLERNVDLATGVLDTLETDTVGTGIVPSASVDAFKRWSESTQCDADGRNDLAGIEKLVTRSAWRDGEVLVRRRWRGPTEDLALPLQLQVLEADYLDTAKEADFANGSRIVQGVELDPLNARVAYWLFPSHPGSMRGLASMVTGSRRVPASEILHIFNAKRAGQVRGVSPFAPAIVRFQDFDELDDATLMKQKVAACLAVITSDVEGTAPPLGSAVAGSPGLDSLEPGTILNAAPGRTVTVVDPPRVNEYAAYSKTVLRRLAKPFGITYEALTGDFSEVNFSSARMGRIGYQGKVESWRWQVLVLQLLNPVWAWAGEAAIVSGLPAFPATSWTAPGLPMIEPDKEGLAIQRNIRTGAQTLFEAIRERGYEPRAFLQEMADGWKLLDELGLVLDCDPRRMSQQGILHPNVPSPVAEKPAAKPATPPASQPADEG